MKKLLLLIIIPLLFGCAREYRCDAGPPCESDIETEGVFVVLGTVCDAIITVDWPDGKKEAAEICDESFNNDVEVFTPGYTQSCTCEKDN